MFRLMTLLHDWINKRLLIELCYWMVLYIYVAGGMQYTAFLHASECIPADGKSIHVLY